jgi:hypothetical protein
VDEDLKGIILRIANHQKITNDKVNTLSVPHLREMVCDALQNVFKLLHPHLGNWQSAIDAESPLQVLLDLDELFMVDERDILILLKLLPII